jgi:hypothetical protein
MGTNDIFDNNIWCVQIVFNGNCPKALYSENERSEVSPCGRQKKSQITEFRACVCRNIRRRFSAVNFFYSD